MENAQIKATLWLQYRYRINECIWWIHFRPKKHSNSFKSIRTILISLSSPSTFHHRNIYARQNDCRTDGHHDIANNLCDLGKNGQELAIRNNCNFNWSWFALVPTKGSNGNYRSLKWKKWKYLNVLMTDGITVWYRIWMEMM